MKLAPVSIPKVTVMFPFGLSSVCHQQSSSRRRRLRDSYRRRARCSGARRTRSVGPSQPAVPATSAAKSSALQRFVTASLSTGVDALATSDISGQVDRRPCRPRRCSVRCGSRRRSRGGQHRCQLRCGCRWAVSLVNATSVSSYEMHQFRGSAPPGPRAAAVAPGNRGVGGGAGPAG
jgi:hypothetical protein